MQKDNKEILALSSKSDFIIYKDNEDNVQVDVMLMNENIWLTQAQMAELFGKDVSGISRHIKNIFEAGELDEKSNLHFLQIANSDKPVAFYSLDTIISVGYRVNSHRATMFRIWATKILKEYLIKGFSMNDERLKNPEKVFGKDYFEEQLERIRNIPCKREKILSKNYRYIC